MTAPRPPFANDPFEDTDEEIPPSLRTLQAWLDAKRAGTAPYEVDRNEGVGVWFSDPDLQHNLPDPFRPSRQADTAEG